MRSCRCLLAGQLVRIRGAAGVRRVLLRSTRQHIDYEVRKDTVTVLAIWSAIRGRGPGLDVLRGARPRKRPKR
jgi:hypothetical protein